MCERQDQLVETLEASFSAARTACPAQLVEQWYIIAGKTTRIRSVGRILAGQIHRPFAHLAVTPQANEVPDLRVDLWDESVTGVLCPKGLNTPKQPMIVAGTLAYSDDGRTAEYVRPGAVSWLLRDRSRIVGWRSEGANLALLERVKPLPVVLSIWLHDLGIHLIHASLVARGDRGVLFTGANGAGKSSSALACLCAGFDFLGDDQVGLEKEGDGAFAGYGLFSTSRMETGQLLRYPLLAPYAESSYCPTDPKPLLFLSEIAPERLRERVPIRLIMLPRVVDTPVSRIRPATQREALLALAPATLLQISPGGGATGLQTLAQCVRRVPSYWLELGGDIETIPRRVDEVLSMEGVYPAKST